MPRTPTTTEIPLPEEVENALMGLSVEQEDGSLTTVRLLLERIREDVAAIERTLGSNHLVTLATKDLMKANRRRGAAEVHVNSRGVLSMRIGKGSTGQVQGLNHTTAPGGAGLPSLLDLRRKAESLGIDISHLGRRKRAIMKAIAADQDVLDDQSNGQPETGQPRRLRDEVGTSPPLPTAKLPRRR